MTAAGAFLKLPLGAVSLTLRFLSAALAGVLLGPRRGQSPRRPMWPWGWWDWPYMYLILNVYLEKALPVWTVVWTGMVVYLPGDALKIAAVAAAYRPLRRALER